jgi:lipopolysaccharide export system permease protein
MMVLFTSGMGWGLLTRITLKLAIVIMLLEGGLTLGCVPLLEEYRAHIIAEGEAVGVMQAMIPGRFQSTSDGKIVFYLENVSARDQILEGVFIAERPKTLSVEDNNWTFITADSAHLGIEKNAQVTDYFLVLNKGHRYEGKPGKADFTVLQFAEYGREIEQKPAPVSRDFLKYKSSDSLWHSEDPKDKGELQLRLSMALSVFLLALLAIPLSYVHPRQGRFSKFLPAILIFIVYYNGFTVSKRWVATGWVPSWIGVWWIHILVFLLAIAWLAHVSGWWSFYVSHPKNRRIKS